MCGIAGYVGTKSAVEVVLDQLKRLEYRGYDSAGVAYLNGSGITTLKRAGKLSELEGILPSSIPATTTAIAHSRWATHGAPTDINAHPHSDQFGKIALIHNGIVENYLDLKEGLVREGHAFQSETDTEVAAHLIGKEYEAGVSLEEALRRGVRKMRGAYAFVAVSQDEPDKIVAVRAASPLVVGLGEGETLLASDIPALLPYTRRVVVLESGQVAILTKGGLEVTDLNGAHVDYEPFTADWDVSSAEKGGHEHFMLKEIYEQPEVVHQCLAGRLSDDNRVVLDSMFSDHVLQDIDRINVIACGTAYHAGLMAKFVFERMLRLPTDVFYSSEFRYGDPVLSQRSLAIFVSQSGETADSLAALRLCKARRIRTLGVVNVVGSSIARECDRVLFTQAGPEISVASTKAYTAQVIVLMLLAHYIAQVREMPGVRTAENVARLRRFGEYLQDATRCEDQIKGLAEQFKDAPLVFFLGRGADASLALEGALKLKEIAYMPTQECPAGEMKHGPLALVEDGVPAIFGATDADVREKLASNIREVQARKGFALAITTADDTSLEEVADAVVKVPQTGNPYLNALLTIVPMQLFAYHMARARGCEIDQPRNLAKSVTVE
ncbi:MAG TPA: glutamine--fructose-6-phosphate transaminase (isomerizing) [Fimbriimonadaceae bacterium]|nr:glutamine--fructose-6-phosphate transaminase (isomerizing) [Fimbriimonadaceae bacterium]